MAAPFCRKGSSQPVVATARGDRRSFSSASACAATSGAVAMDALSDPPESSNRLDSVLSRPTGSCVTRAARVGELNG
ncbi:hypothetical protein H6P81_017295 [Aristolochia fimbriata]|uniref:Uncharacterized protein n=1 Tax=Aristolochia fimbriata TaxID=158543 RepID=A0AAV7DZ38_ARIFI|nr:hypothetical protein H6P81_017295 [Aristolochia fimbriata]